MISGVNFASDKKFDQVYVTDFGGVRIYPLPYIRDYHTSLYQYFLYSSVTYHLQLDNAWYITRSSKWNIFLDKGGGIQILHSEPHSPFHKKYKMDIKELQRLSLNQMKLYDAPLHMWYKAFLYYAHIRSCMAWSDYIRIKEMPPRELILLNTFFMIHFDIGILLPVWVKGETRVNCWNIQ